jgi:hypothetical protein
MKSKVMLGSAGQLLCILFVLIVPFHGLKVALAATSSTSLPVEGGDVTDTPFYKPQTNFVFGKVAHNFTLSQNGSSRQFNLDRGGLLSTFGFDIEGNQSRFLNIGAAARFSSASGLLDPNLPAFDPYILTESSCTLGGFVRAFYVPSFLSGRSITTNVFARLDLGAGPVFLPSQLSVVGGLLVQTAFHVGIETYFSRWFGLGLSYGQIYEWGAVTLGTSGSIFNQGSETIVSIKTTLF